jgi:hypothetical protein
MRLWSLHPRYLDTPGLVAVWREGLLAQAVVAGRTRGYRRHPQLQRFSEAPVPEHYVAAYLDGIHAEAARRGYRFDSQRIGPGRVAAGFLSVTDGQLGYEWLHLRKKLAARDPRWLERFGDVTLPDPHPLFRVVPGDVASWETGRRPDPAH